MKDEGEKIQENIKTETYNGVTITYKDKYAELTLPSGKTYLIINALPHHITIVGTTGKTIHIQRTTPTPFRLEETRVPLSVEGETPPAETHQKEFNIYPPSLPVYKVEEPLKSLVDEYDNIMRANRNALLVVSPIAYMGIVIYLQMMNQLPEEERSETFRKMMGWEGSVVMVDTSLGAVRDEKGVVIGTTKFVGGPPRELVKQPLVIFRRLLFKSLLKEFNEFLSQRLSKYTHNLWRNLIQTSTKGKR